MMLVRICAAQIEDLLEAWVCQQALLQSLARVVQLALVPANFHEPCCFLAEGVPAGGLRLLQMLTAQMSAASGRMLPEEKI